MKASEKQIRLKELGIYLKSLRESKSWSQKDLEAYSGVDSSNIGQIERGERDASSTTLMKLGDALEVDLVLKYKKA